jgi:hypothetical protein
MHRHSLTLILKASSALNSAANPVVVEPVCCKFRKPAFYLSERTALEDFFNLLLVQFLDRRRIGAVFRIVLSGGTGVEIVVAPSLLPA